MAVFEAAKEKGIHRTIHAGEAGPADCVKMVGHRACLFSLMQFLLLIYFIDLLFYFLISLFISFFFFLDLRHCFIHFSSNSFQIVLFK